MPPRAGLQHHPINTFKGVNLSDPPHVIDDREFETVTNLIVNDAGDLVRRKPLRWFRKDPASTTTKMIGVFYGRIVYSDNDDIRISPESATVTNPDWQILSGDGESHEGPLGLVYNDNLYIPTGSSVPALLAYDVDDWLGGTPVATPITVTGDTLYNDTCKAVMFKDRMFTIKHPYKQSSDVYYSELFTPESTASGNIFKVNPGDGDFITDIIPFGERLFIFKRFSTWMLIPAAEPSSWILKNFDKSIGANICYSTLEYRGLLYVLSYRGLYRTDGVVYDYVGYPVQSRWDNAGPTDVTGMLAYASQIVKIDDYILVNSGTPAIGYWCYNPVQNAWTEFVFPTIASRKLTLGVQGVVKNFQGTWFGYSGHPELLWYGFLDPDHTTNDQYDDLTTDDGTVTRIDVAFKTKFWDFAQFQNVRRHYQTTVEIVVPDQSYLGFVEFETKHAFDRSKMTPPYEFGVSDKQRGLMAHRIPGPGYNRRLQLQLNSSTPADFQITGYDLAYFKKRDMSETAQ